MVSIVSNLLSFKSHQTSLVLRTIFLEAGWGRVKSKLFGLVNSTDKGLKMTRDFKGIGEKTEQIGCGYGK